MGMLDDFEDPQVAGKRSLLDSFDSSSPDPTQHGHGADRPAQAALEGFGEIVSGGYLPQAQAAVETGTSAIGNSYDKLKGYIGGDISKTDEGLRQQGFKLPEQSYLKSRDENIARQAGLEESNPYASAGGKFAGIITSAALPLGQAAKGAGLVAKMGRGAATGAIQGALYNPGDTAGEISPIQAGPRAENAAIGGAIGGTLASVGHGLGGLADKNRMVNRIKESHNLSRSVKDEIDQALQGVNQKYIKPRADEIRGLLEGHNVDVNPERLKGVSRGLDKYADTLQRKYGTVIPPQVSSEITVGATNAPLTSGVEKVLPPESVSIPANKANRLKQLLDARAKYAESKPFDTGSTARGETAKKAADVLRGKVADIHPKVDDLNKEMGEAIKYRRSVARQSETAPISSIRGRPGTDKGSIVDAIDKWGGSHLEETSSKIEDARKLLLNPINLVKPLELPNELRKMAVRGASGAARPIDAAVKKLPAGTKNAILQGLLEKKR